MKKAGFAFLLFYGLFFSVLCNAQGWQWGRGSTGGGIDAWSIATDQFGNIFISGTNFSVPISGAASPSVFGSYAVPISSTSGVQCIITKYDSLGNVLWAVGTQNSDTYLMSIATDKNGNSFLFGAINSPTVEIGSFTLINTIYPEAQYFLAKLDPTGVVLWAKNAGNVQGTETEGLIASFEVQILSTGGIATDDSGNIYITANFNLPTVTVGTYTLTSAGGADDILLVKYDSTGNVKWATSAGGSGYDEAYGLTVTPAGDIYITGLFNSPTIAFGSSIITDTSVLGNVFIARYNNAGIPLWASSSGGTGYEFAVGLASDASNNVYLTGGVSDSVISFNGTNIVNPHTGNPALYLIKFDTSNSVSWYKTIASPTGGEAWGCSIAISPCGAVWVSGSFSDSLIIDDHVLNAPLGSTDPVFIAGFNTNGGYVGAAALQSGSDDQNGIACDGKGNIYTCADYEYYCPTFTIGKDTLPDIPTSDINEWAYVAKYSTIGDLSQQLQDTAFCQGTPFQYTMYADVLTGGTVLWSTGSTQSLITVADTGRYWVVVTNAGCTYSDTVMLTRKVCGDCNAFLPLAFTPNNDGENDTYHPVFENGCYIGDYSFSIYNRWGQQIFQSEDPTAKWDGTFKGVKEDMGVYMYYLKYTTASDKSPHLMKGDVTLIR